MHVLLLVLKLLLLFSVFGDDPIVTIIETNPVINPVEGKIISEKNKDVQLTCVVENKPKYKEVRLRDFSFVFFYKSINFTTDFGVKLTNLKVRGCR